MSKFADLTFNFETPSLNAKYNETRMEEKKQRMLNEIRIRYWTQVYEQLDNVMRGLVSNNYKNEKSFFNQIRQIKERGIHFFEKLLELDISERYNHYLLAQLVMYYDICINCDINFTLENDEYYTVNIYAPSFTIDNLDGERNTFQVLIYNLNIHAKFIFEDLSKSKKIKKEDLLKVIDIECSFNWFDDTDSYNPENYFLN